MSRPTDTVIVGGEASTCQQESLDYNDKNDTLLSDIFSEVQVSNRNKNEHQTYSIDYKLPYPEVSPSQFGSGSGVAQERMFNVYSNISSMTGSRPPPGKLRPLSQKRGAFIQTRTDLMKKLNSQGSSNQRNIRLK